MVYLTYNSKLSHHIGLAAKEILRPAGTSKQQKACTLGQQTNGNNRANDATQTLRGRQTNRTPYISPAALHEIMLNDSVKELANNVKEMAQLQIRREKQILDEEDRDIDSLVREIVERSHYSFQGVVAPMIEERMNDVAREMLETLVDSVTALQHALAQHLLRMFRERVRGLVAHLSPRWWTPSCTAAARARTTLRQRRCPAVRCSARRIAQRLAARRQRTAAADAPSDATLGPATMCARRRALFGRDSAVRRQPALDDVPPRARRPARQAGQRVVARYDALRQVHCARAGIVHRLDKGTFGIMIVAKTRGAHKRLSVLFAARLVHKDWTALTVHDPYLPGCIYTTIEQTICCHPEDRMRIAIVRRERGGCRVQNVVQTVPHAPDPLKSAPQPHGRRVLRRASRPARRQRALRIARRAIHAARLLLAADAPLLQAAARRHRISATCPHARRHQRAHRCRSQSARAARHGAPAGLRIRTVMGGRAAAPWPPAAVSATSWPERVIAPPRAPRTRTHPRRCSRGARCSQCRYFAHMGVARRARCFGTLPRLYLRYARDRLLK
ncbi:23S rRNA pseudouridylate synthase [Gracilaria domingensis]|nr:23S rRNA pseudouridylate synthase [Gracilaria domingensis]